MDFFQRQEDARRRSRRIVFLYVPLVATLCLGPAFLYAFVVKASRGPSMMLTNEEAADCAVLKARGKATLRRFTRNVILTESNRCIPHNLYASLAIAGTLGGIILFGSWLKLSQLRNDSGGHLSRLLGARQILPMGKREPDEIRLHNVVEEMCIAAGMPLPRVYLMPDETSINAFAAGSDVLDASVFFTRGAIDRLTREELQGVVGHELGHVLSGDVRVNMMLAGILHGIVLISEFGQEIMQWAARSRSRSSSRDKGGIIVPLLVVGAAVWLLGILGVLFAQILKAGFSRQREWAADALSAQFTRNPQSLASALGRILADSRNGHSSLLAAAHAEQVSHMCFSRGVKSLLPSLETHPPLEARIAALGGNPDRIASGLRRTVARSVAAPSGAPLKEFEELGALGLGSAGTAPLCAASPTPSSAPPACAPSASAAPEAWTADTPSTPPGDETDRILRGLPRTPDDARVAFLGLLLWQNPTSRETHLDYLSRIAPAPVLERIRAYASSLSPRSAAEVVATCDMSLAVLRTLPLVERKAFVKGLEEFVRVDGRVSFFETCLVGLARSLLGAHAGLSITCNDPRKLLPHVRAIVSMLVWARTSFVDTLEADTRRMSLYGHAMETFLGNAAPAQGSAPDECVGRYLGTKELSPERVWIALETISLGRPTLRARIAAAISTTLQGPKSAGEEGDLRLFSRVVALHLNVLGVG